MSEKRPGEENPQEMYLKISAALKQLEPQVGAMQNQLELIYRNIETYEISKMTIENIKDLKENDEILVPIGNVILSKMSIKDPQNFIVNVGSDIAIEKTYQDVIKYLEKNIEILNKSREQAEKDYERLMENIQSLQEQKNMLLQYIQGAAQQEKRSL